MKWVQKPEKIREKDFSVQVLRRRELEDQEEEKLGENINSVEGWLVAGVESHIEENITMEIHVQGSEESYKMKKKGVKEIYKNQMSQEEQDKEIVERTI